MVDGVEQLLLRGFLGTEGSGSTTFCCNVGSIGGNFDTSFSIAPNFEIDFIRLIVANSTVSSVNPVGAEWASQSTWEFWGSEVAIAVSTPATLALLGLGFIGLGWSKRKRFS